MNTTWLSGRPPNEPIRTSFLEPSPTFSSEVPGLPRLRLFGAGAGSSLFGGPVFDDDGSTGGEIRLVMHATLCRSRSLGSASNVAGETYPSSSEPAYSCRGVEHSLDGRTRKVREFDGEGVVVGFSSSNLPPANGFGRVGVLAEDAAVLCGLGAILTSVSFVRRTAPLDGGWRVTRSLFSGLQPGQQ